MPCDTPCLPSDSVSLVNRGGKKIWLGAGSHKSSLSIKVKHSQFLLPRPMGKEWVSLHYLTLLPCKTGQLHPKRWLCTVEFTNMDRAAGNRPGSLLWQAMAKPGVLWQSQPDATGSPNSLTEWKYVLNTHESERKQWWGA